MNKHCIKDLKKRFYIDKDSNLRAKIATRYKKVGDVVTSNCDGYQRLRIDGKMFSAHRVIWAMETGEWPDGQIDHKVHGFDNRSNNNIDNLRVVSHRENSMNRSKSKANTSGVTGVGWYAPACKWVARIHVDSKSIYLGIFTDKNDAIVARKEAEIKYGFTNG